MIRWLTAIIILPGTVLILVPLVLLWLSSGRHWLDSLANPSTLEFWVAIVSGLLGLFLSLWTMTLFFRFGEGTAAPWAPPQRLVIKGPYRYVRNPMMIGVFMMLFAESLLLQSRQILIWLAISVAANLVYIPIFEEKGLKQRFGRDYLVYKRHVPRWIPRLTAWKGGEEEA